MRFSAVSMAASTKSPDDQVSQFLIPRTGSRKNSKDRGADGPPSSSRRSGTPRPASRSPRSSSDLGGASMPGQGHRRLPEAGTGTTPEVQPYTGITGGTTSKKTGTTGGIRPSLRNARRFVVTTIRRSNRPVPLHGSHEPFSIRRGPIMLNRRAPASRDQPPGLDAPPPDAGPEAGPPIARCGSRPRFSPISSRARSRGPRGVRYRSRSPVAPATTFCPKGSPKHLDDSRFTFGYLGLALAALLAGSALTSASATGELLSEPWCATYGATCQQPDG